MLITFEFVESADAAEVMITMERRSDPGQDEGGKLAQVVREAETEIMALYQVLREIVAAVDSDPDAGPFQRTTLTLVRDVAMKALNEGRE